MRHAWTHKLQLSGPTVHSLYCDLVMLCKFTSLSLFIFLVIPYTAYEHRRILICMTKFRAGFATGSVFVYIYVTVRFFFLANS